MNVETNGIFIPKRFTNIVALHITKNLLNYEEIRTPLILGIHGPSGEGKTFQCEYVLEEMGVTPIHISARDLESERAGEPASLVCKRYWEASTLVTEGRTPMTVLFINDLDAGIGKWGSDVQYTVNTQIVIGTLMNIADYPEFVGERNTVRIPIIVTGNDFTKLYDPLTREGRMVSYSWVPTLDEKTEVVRNNIFPMQALSNEEIARLVEAYQQMPIAFFALIKSSLFDAQLLEKIESEGLSKIIRSMKKIRKNRIQPPQYSFGMLMDKAKELISNEIVNHLASRR